MEWKRYLFKFYYIGLNKYYGSQRQKNLLTIEECILHALKKKNYINDTSTSGFEVASRTDRYVSARGSTFSFLTKKTPILMEINSALPEEIGVWAFTEVPIDFLSRFNATLRWYKYIVFQPLIFLEKTKHINLNLVLKACKELEGHHDFKNFSKWESEEEKTIRDMEMINLSIENGFLVFEFKSRAFLRQQIRRMVKKIMEVGMGEISYNEFLNLLYSKKRISYQPVSPKGLILWDIQFEEGVKLKVDQKSLKRMKEYFQYKNLEYGLKHQLYTILQQNDFC